jgi:hypothetical protein
MRIYVSLCLWIVVTGLRAPIPSQAQRTSNSIVVEFDEFHSVDGSINIEYELSYKPLFSSNWFIAEYDKSRRNAAYFLSVNVDLGKTITTGYFKIGFGHSSALPSDFEEPTYSLPIQWDSSSSQLLLALSNIQGISVNQVTRCQDGYAEHSYPCPNEASGAYQWLIILNAPVQLSTDLYILESRLGNSWSGQGPQVQISRFEKDMTASNQCINQICQRNVTNLNPSMGYSFRLRVLTNMGWTPHGPSSKYASTLEARPPSRPTAPIVFTIYGNTAVLEITPPPSIEGVTLIESEYRPVQGSIWLSGSTVDWTKTNATMGNVITLTSLSSGVYYEMRFRYFNHYGYSLYSTPSESFTIPSVASVANNPIDPLFAITSVTSNTANISVRSDASILTGTNTYQIQYKATYEPTWRLVPNTVSLIASVPGVFTQQISTRSDYISGCLGYFRISMGTVDPTFIDPTVSVPLAFDASVTDIENAISSMKVISGNTITPIIIVRRDSNLFNGYVWTVEISNLNAFAPIQIYKNTFLYNSTESCFSYGDTVISQITSNGLTTYFTQTASILVGSLGTQTAYEFRLHITTSDLLNLYSGSKNATTPIELIETTSKVSATLPYASAFSPAVGGSIVEAAINSSAARRKDFYYSSPVGSGGALNEGGSSGYCVAVLHDLFMVDTYRSKVYYYSGSEQRLSVPLAAGTTNLVTFKCWGGGGGGAKSSRGGGGAFAQLTIRVSPGDVYIIKVGGGGKTS